MELLIEQLSSSPIVTVCQVVRRWRAEVDPLWQLSLFLDLSEFFIKLHAAHAFELFRAAGLHHTKRDAYDEMRRRLATPTIGDWKHVFTKSIEGLKGQKTPGILAVLSTADLIRISAGALVDLRNKHAHGATPSRERAVASMDANRKHLSEVALPFIQGLDVTLTATERLRSDCVMARSY